MAKETKKHPTLAARSRPQAKPAPAATPGDLMAQMQAQFLKNLNSDLHARSGHPTLAERVAAEGYAAQLGKGPKKNARKKK